MANKSEPIPLLQGSTRVSVIAVASGACTSLPLRASRATAACVPSGCNVETADCAKIGCRRDAYGNLQSNVLASPGGGRCSFMIESDATSRRRFLERFLALLANVRKADEKDQQDGRNQKAERNRPVQKYERITARQQQCAAQVLLHHRPQHETEQQRRRLALQLHEHDAEETEECGLHDVEARIVDGVYANRTEQQDRRIQHSIRHGQQL